MKEKRKKKKKKRIPTSFKYLEVMYFKIYSAWESRKSDVEIFYCEEGGWSGFVLLAKEKMLFSPLQACIEQENFLKKIQVLLQVILSLFLSESKKHSKSTWLLKADTFSCKSVFWWEMSPWLWLIIKA